MTWIISGILIGIAVGIPLIIFFILASKDMWFTFVQEGRAKIVVRAGRFKKALIQWEGRTFDYRNPSEEEKWNIIEGKERHLFGGLRFYGLWPLDRIYTYKFQWTGVTENGEIQHHPKEKLDYILLKDDVYWAKVEKAEDVELLPLDVEVILTLKVANPYKALFAVQNWLETIINRTKPAVRDSITLRSYKEIISAKEAVGEEIYKRLEERDLLKTEFFDRYGIDFRKSEVKEINPEDKYRDATLREWLGSRESEARGVETIGAVIQMISRATGKSICDIQQEIDTDPELKKEFRLFSQDLIHRRMGIDGKAYLDVRTANSIQDLIALWRRMPMGGGEPEGEGSQKGKKKGMVSAFGKDWEVEVKE